MFQPTRLLTAVFAAVLTACSSPDPAVDESTGAPTLTDPVPMAEVKGDAKRFVIRDKQKRLRVDGRERGGHMDGPWVYYDSKGEKLAVVSYKLDQRHGPAQLFYVAADGPAAGRLRMTGAFVDGARNGMAESRWASSGKKLERDFDRGILQGARGWRENGARMGDGEAMTAAINESRAEDALLTELENFVQLQLRRKGGQPVDVPEMELALPRINPAAAAPDPEGTAPLSNP